MAKSSLTLWIDVDTNRILNGWNSNNEAIAPTFVAGDITDVQIHLVRKGSTAQFEEISTSGKSFKLAIGKIDAIPDGGFWTLAYGSSQVDFDYNETAASVQSALNLIPEIIADGGVTVTKVNGDTTYRVAFNNKVVISSTFSTDASNLLPSSIVQKNEVKVGSSTTKAVWHFKPKQIPVAYQPDWTQIANNSIATLTVLSQDSIRASIEPDAPRGGTYTLSGFVEKTLTSAPFTVTTENFTTTPISVFATESEIDAVFPNQLNAISNGVTVKKVGEYAWDLSFSPVVASDGQNEYDVRYVIQSITTNAILPFYGVSSSISLNNYETVALLAGVASADAVLEVEMTETDAITTVLQTSCKIVSDIIGQHTYSPTPFDDPITQSDLDASLANYALLSGASFTGNVTTTGRVGIGGGVANDPANKLAIYNGNIVFSIGYGLKFGDGTTQTTAPVPFDPTGYATESWVTSQNYIDDTELATALTPYLTSADAVSTYYPLTNPSGYITASALTPYALLSGATFTGKINATTTATNAGFNIIPQTNAPTSTVAGDIWVGVNHLFFTDSTNVTRTVVNNNTTNTFSTNQIISGTTTQPLLRITQTGTGNSFVVEDGTPNPNDTSAFVVNNDGSLGIGVDPATWTTTNKLEVQGTALFGGKANFTSVAGQAGLNIGIGGTNTSATVAGDMWITTGGANLNFRDGTGAWKVVASLSNGNTFTQPQVIQTVTTASLPPLRLVNQATTSTVHSFVVEDSNPDSDAFVIDNFGNVGIGVDDATGAWTATQKFELNGNIKFLADSSVQTTAYIPSNVALTGGTINGSTITIDGGTY